MRLSVALLACGWLAVSPCGAGSLLPPLTSQQDLPEPVLSAVMLTPAELQSAGYRVGQIEIRARDIFATDRASEDTLLFRLGNLLHLQTRDQTIRNHLFFKSGERFSADRLAASERNLRATGYLDKVSIKPIGLTGDRVNLRVESQDLWSLNPGLSYSRAGGADSYSLAVEELNLLGLGHYFRAGFDSGVARDSINVDLGLSHLANTPWQLDLGAADNSDGQHWSAELSHPFGSLDGGFSARLAVEQRNQINSVYQLGRVVSQHRQTVDGFEAYRGWSAGLQQGWTTRHYLGLSARDIRYSAVDTTRLEIPDNRNLVYPWYEIARQQNAWQTRRDRLLLGKTEDSNPGWQLAVKAGLAAKSLGADRNAMILAGSIARGGSWGDTNDWQAQAYMNGRLEAHHQWADTGAGGWFRLFHHWSPRHKSYGYIRVDQRNNSDGDEQLLLGGNNGLRGYPLNYQDGNARWLLTLEQRWYSRWYPFRLFNVGAAVFADAGETLGSTATTAASLGVLRDIGAGLRLGNARSGIGRVIHIDIAVPLDGDDSIDDWQLLVQTRSSF